MTLSASAMTKTWSFGEMFTTAGDITEQTTIDGMTFTAGSVDATSGKFAGWTIAAGTYTDDATGFTTTMQAKSGGQSSWIGQPTNEDPGLPESQWTPGNRMISFDVDGPCDITIYYAAANKSAADRFARLYAGSAENQIWEEYAEVGGACRGHLCRYTGAAATLYMYVNGINVYGVTVGEATAQPDQYELYTYVEVADGSLNPDGLTDENGALGTIAKTPTMPAGGYDEGTEVTLTYSPANNFIIDHWENANGDNLGNGSSIKVTVDADNTDITAFVQYVDPFNPAPGYVDPSTVSGASIRNWMNEPNRGLTCIPLSAGFTSAPAKNDFNEYPWPSADNNKGYDWNALQASAKGTANISFDIRVAEGGINNIVAAIADKGKDENAQQTTASAQILNDNGDVVAEGDAVVYRTFQDWNFNETKFVLDQTVAAGTYKVNLTIGQTDTGRQANILYIISGNGDNYGNWSTKDPAAGVEEVEIDNVNAPVRYFNLQGIEVSADTKGLLILSNGTKVLNK